VLVVNAPSLGVRSTRRPRFGQYSAVASGRYSGVASSESPVRRLPQPFRRPSRTRLRLLALVAVFLLSRLVCAYLAGTPEVYTGNQLPVTMDPQAYRRWAAEIADAEATPYADVRIEYPPGVLPFIVLPHVIAPSQPYLLGFVAEMVLIDAVGLLGLVILARRWGSELGPWLWVLGLPILGPVSWARLDIIPAVATIWVFVAADSTRWGLAGGLAALAALTKVYQLFLMPAMWLLSAQRRRLVIGFLIVAAATVLPFLPVFRDLASSVGGYHLHRGVQAESTWGNALSIAHLLGYQVSPTFQFGALDLESGVSSLLIAVSTVLSILALVPGILFARVERVRGDAKALAAISFVTLSLLLVTGRVLSPQYLLWVLGVGAAVGCVSAAPLRPAVLALLPASLLTQILYPFLMRQLAWGWPLAVTILTLRNAILAGIAGWSLTRLWREYRPSVHDDVRLEVVRPSPGRVGETS
jgi:hypothetical protein